MAEPLGPICEEIVIARPSDQVWRTLTDEASVPRWLGCMRYKREISAVFYMQMDRQKAALDDVSGATHCEILALDAPYLFRFSWFLPGTPATFVSFRLQVIDQANTRVVFEHDGWDKFPAEQIKPIRDMLVGGWKGFVLPNLQRVAASDAL